MLQADQRWWRTGDGGLVADGHVDAAILAYTPGGQISPEDELLLPVAEPVDEPPADDPPTEPPPVDEPPADDPPTEPPPVDTPPVEPPAQPKARRQPPNKARKAPAADKGE